MGQERRKEPRIPTKTPVKLRPTEGVTPYSTNSESLNMSNNGVLFVLESPLKIGTHVDLAFVMPTEVTGGLPVKVRCQARVVRVDHAGVPEGKSGIAAHIERFETIVAEL
jgi:hypothetical protein